jgi:putative chitobiose transport system permease protein
MTTIRSGRPRTGSLRPGAVIIPVLGFLVALAFFLPVVWMFSMSIRTNTDIFANFQPFSIWSLVPHQVTFDNFANLFASSFGRAILNSVVVATITVTLGLVTSGLAAYALATIDFPGKSLVFVALVVGFSIPFDAVSVPLASQLREVGLTNTFFGLAVSGLGNGLAILLLRQFFLNIPPELAEAARMDGASSLRVFLQIYLPLAKGPIVAAGMTLFVFQWQAYLWPVLVASDPSMQVGPVAVASFVNLGGEVDFGLTFAGALVISIVPTTILLLVQRQFIQSVTTSGVNG